jgi:hypothetical protein
MNKYYDGKRRDTDRDCRQVYVCIRTCLALEQRREREREQEKVKVTRQTNSKNSSLFFSLALVHPILHLSSSIITKNSSSRLLIE